MSAEGNLLLSARRAGLVGAAMMALWLCCGCTVRAARSVSGSGSFASTPPGPTAVLRVTTAPAVAVRTGQTNWGLVTTANVEARFAEFLADAAARDGGMSVLPPLDVEQRLSTAGLKLTLQPDEDQRRQYAKALGCASYLTAYVERSQLQYRFFLSWADVSFTVACYVPGQTAPVWQVQISRLAPGKTDREAIALALAEMFQWLKGIPFSEELPRAD